jgi:hypothetical protein
MNAPRGSFAERQLRRASPPGATWCSTAMATRRWSRSRARRCQRRGSARRVLAARVAPEDFDAAAAPIDFQRPGRQCLPRNARCDCRGICRLRGRPRFVQPAMIVDVEGWRARSICLVLAPTEGRLARFILALPTSTSEPHRGRAQAVVGARRRLSGDGGLAGSEARLAEWSATLYDLLSAYATQRQRTVMSRVRLGSAHRVVAGEARHAGAADRVDRLVARRRVSSATRVEPSQVRLCSLFRRLPPRSNWCARASRISPEESFRPSHAQACRRDRRRHGA